jgi:hypothetical protein
MRDQGIPLRGSLGGVKALPDDEKRTPGRRKLQEKGISEGENREGLALPSDGRIRDFRV